MICTSSAIRTYCCSLGATWCMQWLFLLLALSRNCCFSLAPAVLNLADSSSEQKNQNIHPSLNHTKVSSSLASDGHEYGLFGVFGFSYIIYALVALPVLYFIYHTKFSKRFLARPTMVFENILVEVLNRVLGDYVENLDSNQLNVGIWHGNVSLQNLRIKESALDDLDLPIKTKLGFIGKLVLQVPWKNLYTKPVVVKIDGLYLLAMPKLAIQYDAEKAEKAVQDAKQRELQRIEAKKALEKAARQTDDAAKNDKGKKNQGFVEKLVTQIIKNLQIEITNIHVRYEDRYTTPESPFACGITLSQANFQTTDKNWTPTYVSNDDPLSLVQYIFKLVELDSLSLYWNPHLNTQFGQLSRTDAPEFFRDAIAIYQPPPDADVSDVRPSNVSENEIKIRKVTTADYSYVLEPIYSYAHLRLNQNPELEDFKIPKITLELTLKKLGLVLSRNQYQQLMEFLEGLEGLACRAQHMKYDPVNERPIQRPNAAAWWKFAYRCVLGETVRPHKRSWSWAHIKEHREQMRRYRDLYRQRLILMPADGTATATPGASSTPAPAKSPLSASMQREVDELEKKLDVFNITLMRQYAEFDAEKVRRGRRPSQQAARRSTNQSGSTQVTPTKEVSQPSPKQTWWQWASGQKVVATDPVGDALDSASAIDEDTARKFREAMTEEEKQRLYAAIGYQETGVPDLEYPRGFVENEFNFVLEEFYLTVRDDELAVESGPSRAVTSSAGGSADDVVVQAMVKSLFTSVKQLPTTQGLQVDVEMGKLEISGCIDPRKRNSATKYEIQKLISSPSESKALLHVRWETHPLDSNSDQRLNVTTSPVQLVYDAYTIDRVMYTFQPPKSVQLKQITAAAVTRFDAFRESSTAGLVNTIQNHQYTEIHVNFAPSYLVLPENGELTEDGRKLILDFGSLSVRTVGGKPSEEGIDPRKSSVEDILDKTYEKYQIDLKKVQLLFVDTPKYHGARDDDARLHAEAAGVDHEALLDWRRARIMEASPLHILSPLNFSVTVENSILAQQIKLPQVRVKAKISPVTVNLSQRQLSSIMQVGLALPMPGASLQPPQQQQQTAQNKAQPGGKREKGGKDSALATPDDSGAEEASTAAAADPSATDRSNEIASRLRLQRDLNAIQSLNTAAGAKDSDAESGVSVSTLNARTSSYLQQQSVMNISPDEQCKLELHFSLMSINLNIFHQEWSERRSSVISDGVGSRRGSKESSSNRSPLLGQQRKDSLKQQLLQQQLWSSKRSPLAYINIAGMKMALDTFQSGRMKIAAQLHNFSIMDVRPGFEHRINELFVPKRDYVARPVGSTPTPSSVSEGIIIPGEKATEMLGLEVTREGGEGGMCRVVVSVCRFQLALSTQFYMAVADFFQKAVEDGLQGSENKREANQRIEQAQQMMSAARQQMGTAATQQFNDIVAIAVDPKKLQSQISLLKQRRKSDAVQLEARTTIPEETDFDTSSASTGTATGARAASDVGDSASATGGQQAEEPAGMPLDITIKIEEPEILLIENADDVDSRVLILKSSIVAQVQILPLEGIIIKFAAQNMQMYQTTFQSMSTGSGGAGSVNPSLHNTPQHGAMSTPARGKSIVGADSIINSTSSDYNFVQILSPIQLSALAKFGADGTQKINVSMTDLRLRVAPSSIQIITAVLNSLTASMAPKEAEDVEIVDKSHMWRTQPVYQDEHWFLQPAPEEQQSIVTVEKRRHRHSHEHRPSKRETFEELAGANTPLNASARKAAAAAQIQKIMQILLLDVGKISISVDSGFGYRAMPMLMLEARIDTQVSNWSKDLCVKGYLELEISFYNRTLDVWEPLLEPVENSRSSVPNRVRPWTVTYEVQRIAGDDGVTSSPANGRASGTAGNGDGVVLEVNAKRAMKRLDRSPSESSMRSSSTVSDATSTQASSSTSSESNAIVKVRMPTQTIIRVDATDELQITVSKITIDVFKDLSASFAEAVRAASGAALQQDEEDELRYHKIAPYWVHNDTGETLALIVTEPLVFADQKEPGKRHDSIEAVLQTGQSIPLRSRRSQVIKSSMLGRHETLTDVGQICIGVRILDRTLTVPIARAERRFFFIPNSGKTDESLGIVTDVEAKQGYKKISIRSQLQFVNQLPTPVELYVKSAPASFYTSGKRTNAPIMLSSVDKFASMNLPCVLMQGDASAQFCFIPGGYYSYSDPFKLTDLFYGRDSTSPNSPSNEPCIRVSCRGGDAQDVFYARVECERQHVLHELSRKKTATSVSYRIILRPVLWICNGLPYEILSRGDTSVSKSVTLAPGDYSAVTNVPFDDGKVQVTLPNYMSCQWSGYFQLDKLIGEKAVSDLPVKLTAVVSSGGGGGADPALSRMPPVYIGIRRQVDRSTPILLLYSPYWIVNRTDKELTYREPEIRHPPPSSSIIQAHTNPNDKPITLGDSPVWNKPLLFCYPPELVRDTSKKYLSLKVEKSQWSDPFSPDAIGSNGVIVCRVASESGRASVTTGSSGPQIYEVGIQIQSSHIVLTKIIVFTPYYIIVNKSSRFDIAIREESSRNPNAWLLVPRQQVMPFWPLNSNTKANPLQRQLISAHIVDTKELTSPFDYAQLKSSLLKLDNHYGGLWHENLINENSAICTLGEFAETASAALIVNYTTSYTVRYRQHGDTAYQQLRPQCKVHFAWSMPARVPLLLDLDVGGKTTAEPLDIGKNAPGGIPLDEHRSIYYAMFLDGVQRVLLITEDVSLALAACHATDLEPISTEIMLTLDKVGFSLVNDTARREVLYAGIVGSGSIWQFRKHGKSRFRNFSVEETRLFETAYTQYNRNKLINAGSNSSLGSGNGRKSSTLGPGSIVAIPQTGYEVMFEAPSTVGSKTNDTRTSENMTGDMGMLIVKPSRMELRRLDQKGVWARLNLSQHQTGIHIKLQRLQIDNPQIGSQFPIVLLPTPLPNDVEMKPLLEASLVMRKFEHSQTTQIKLAMLLIQEMQVSIDQDFINGLVSIFTPEELTPIVSETKMLDSFKTNDLPCMEMTLASSVAQNMGNEAPAYYDKLLLHPLKIHLSFSLSGSAAGASSSSSQQSMNLSQQEAVSRSSSASTNASIVEMPVEFIGLLFKSLGVTLTEVNDCVLKLGLFERDARFMTTTHLLGELQSHYTSQVLKQFYSLVLGLDVIGNPFGLVRGVSEGVKDLFYEPYKGVVEGPEEFVAGVGAGVKSLVGHTVGGTLGTAGRLTGTLGRAFASLTFDEEFQRRRRTMLNRNPNTFGEGMAYSGQHLLSGITEGVTGVFSKPIEGLRTSGAEGFFKGLGKGFIGAVARPTAGLVDFATGTLQTVRTVVAGGETSSRLRLTRFIGSDGVIRPYNLHQAEGFQMFHELEKGAFVLTDEYIDHLISDLRKTFMLILTNRQIFFLERGDIIKNWHIQWRYQWHDLIQAPALITNAADGKREIQVLLVDEKRKSGLLKPKKSGYKVYVEVGQDEAQAFCSRAVKLWQTATSSSIH